MMEDGDFGKITTPQQEALLKTISNIQQLNDIVEDILNASRIEKGKLAISPKEGDVVELAENVVSQLVSRAEHKGLKLTFKTSEKHFNIQMDKNKIYEVVMNIVDNAIHYTQKGSIHVNCQINGEEIVISIKDTGIGIPKSFQKKMFHRFSRSENAKSIRPDGTGIGLYVVKAFVEAHKGKLTYETEEGKGTTFFITLYQKPKFDFQSEEENKKEVTKKK